MSKTTLAHLRWPLVLGAFIFISYFNAAWAYVAGAVFVAAVCFVSSRAWWADRIAAASNRGIVAICVALEVAVYASFILGAVLLWFDCVDSTTLVVLLILIELVVGMASVYFDGKLDADE